MTDTEKKSELKWLGEWLDYTASTLKTSSVVYIVEVARRKFAYQSKTLFLEHIRTLLDDLGSVKDGSYNCAVMTEKAWLEQD